jgi:hypothetical protein
LLCGTADPATDMVGALWMSDDVWRVIIRIEALRCKLTMCVRTRRFGAERALPSWRLFIGVLNRPGWLAVGCVFACKMVQSDNQ